MAQTAADMRIRCNPDAAIGHIRQDDGTRRYLELFADRLTGETPTHDQRFSAQIGFTVSCLTDSQTFHRHRAFETPIKLQRPVKSDRPFAFKTL